MDKEKIIEKTKEYTEDLFKGESSGHDWWHTYRVWKNSIYIAKKEGADLFVVQLAALLHDVQDFKFCNESELIEQKLAKELLNKLGLDNQTTNHVYNIIKNVSFKGAKVDSLINTKEGMVVQDADRLDAIDSIGIARIFTYGGYCQREIYNPKVKPILPTTFKQYKENKSTSINHFYEKTLLLKDLMNTETARKIAEEKHKFVELFLNKFLKGWEGIL